MKTYYFEKLEVWQDTRAFVKQIYEMTTGFPVEEKYGITSQLKRASVSIAANIAEGMSRITEKDKARFINQAFSSAIEVINLIIIANDLKLIESQEYNAIRSELEKITNKLNSLYNKFEK
ncbi:four helix bundle protein [Mesohalobacter halotolerans]|uniref:Four helix bundle protein n=1 Tax=Mesohalobacter halotolerans TaxID=1883405 RepID=A0A4V6ALI5_9FLAO|nr:four helix bundle protein [Mesohalobacter halotolerans]TKS56995.1 four helix bundle protein [Mesohalobacter halotolerans]